MEKVTTLADIQALVRAPKSNFNAFGKYKYRSAEDIVEAVKPVINPLGFFLVLTDEIIQVGERIYVKATATLSNGTLHYATQAFAREEDIKKGMDSAQVTGAASSYARKYALNGLFAIDHTKDADATNEHKDETPTKEEKALLFNLMYKSDLTEVEKEKAVDLINNCPSYKHYENIQHKLEARALPFDQIPNPNQTDINNHIQKLAKA